MDTRRQIIFITIFKADISHDHGVIGQGNSTRVDLDFEYDLHHHWMQNIARTAYRLGFPSVAFDLGLSHIKDEIEKGSS